MINISTLKRLTCVTAMAFAFVLAGGHLTEVKAQRDPFRKAGWATPKKQRPASATPAKPPAPKPVPYAPPTIEARIDYYKRLREAAVANGNELPKVTSVLTLSEMAVTGIFKTPRGYAAMVEATPIKLSYTIYPGEKFFDGQLVAVEENRLVFRKVTKVAEGKFVSSVENKPLRQYGGKDEVTAAVTPAVGESVETANNVGKDGKSSKPVSNPFLSPVDELNAQPEQTQQETVKTAKKPAKNGKNK